MAWEEVAGLYEIGGQEQLGQAPHPCMEASRGRTRGRGPHGPSCSQKLGLCMQGQVTPKVPGAALRGGCSRPLALTVCPFPI